LIKATKSDILRSIPEKEDVEIPDLDQYAHADRMERVEAWVADNQPLLNRVVRQFEATDKQLSSV
jgi:hypothetical protein